MNKISINQIESFLLESADILRGNLDTQGVTARKQQRSKYGAKKPK